MNRNDGLGFPLLQDNMFSFSSEYKQKGRTRCTAVPVCFDGKIFKSFPDVE